MKLKQAQDLLSAFAESVLKMNAEINSVERNYNLIKNTRTADICPQCDGDGGGEYEYDGEECQVCEGCGLVDRADIPKPKTINEYWEEYRLTTNNEDAWSFKEWLRIKLEVEGKFSIVTFTPIEIPANKSEMYLSDVEPF